MIAATELKRLVLASVEGLDQQVENAPDLSPEDFNAWIDSWPKMSPEEQEEKAPEMVFTLAKALRSGAVDIVQVM